MEILFFYEDTSFTTKDLRCTILISCISQMLRYRKGVTENVQRIFKNDTKTKKIK